MENFRCIICNSVSSEEIADMDNYDPLNSFLLYEEGYICAHCSDSIYEALDEFEQEGE